MEIKKHQGLFQQLEDLVEENEKTEARLHFLESVLSRNNIYFLAFTPSTEEIIYHNLPEQSVISRLDNLETILKKDSLDKIRQHIAMLSSDGTSFSYPTDDDPEITFHSDIFEFILFSQRLFPDVLFLQISLINQQNLSRELSEETEMARTQTGLQDIQELLTLLNEIHNMESTGNREEVKKRIHHHYLENLARLQESSNNPILSLCLEIIRKNLTEIVAPAGFLDRLYQVLTPSEIQVAEFIRMGKTSRDIADALDIAQKTVENHRNRVRDKLGLRNKNINLRSYLMQLK